MIVTRAGQNLNPLLNALERAGFDPWLDHARAETEAALQDHLDHGHHEVLILEFNCGVQLDRVRAIVAERTPELPIVIAISHDTVGDEVLRAIGSRRPRLA